MTREVRPSNEIVTNEVVEYEHSFFETRVIDPMGHERRTHRDVDGRTTAVIEVTASGPLQTSYQYGNFGQLVRTTDPLGNDITVSYDVRGRRAFLSDPDAGLTEFHYNGFGDLGRTFVNGTHPRTFRHDAIGRVTEIEDDDGTAFTQYDPAHGVGRIAHTESADGTLQDFEYDDLGRPRAETWTVDGHAYRFDHTYDNFGRPWHMSYPEVPGGLPGHIRFQVTQDYNAKGYLLYVSQTRVFADGTSGLVGDPFIKIEERNADGSLTRAKLGNDIVTRTYNDGTGRLASLKSGSALSLDYGYDLEGHVVRRNDNMQDRLDVFSYDDGPLHRLTKWQRIPNVGASHDVGYGYDNLGNLTQILNDGNVSQINVYGEDQRPHTLTSNSTGAFIYDDRGRQTLAPGRQVDYTEFDLPHRVTTPSGVTSFSYDAANRRVKKTGPEGTTITLGGLYERRESNGSVKHVFYVQGPEGPIAQVTYREGAAEAEREYIHLDALGSVGAVTKENGTVIERLNYEPFGARQDAAGNPVTGPTQDVKLSFAGHRHDDELGLIDMRGRVYDPTNRRFLTPDPHVTNPLSTQSYNRYSYVVNNPVNLTDPTGFDWWSGGCIGLECSGFGGFGFGFGFGGSGGTGASNGGSSPTPSCFSGVCFTGFQMGFRTGGTTGASVQVSQEPKKASVPVGPGAPGMSAMGPLQAVQTNWLGAAAEAAFDVIEQEQMNGLRDILAVFAPGIGMQKVTWDVVNNVRANGIEGVFSLHPAYRAYETVAGAYSLGKGIGSGDPRAIGTAFAQAFMAVVKGAAVAAASSGGTLSGRLRFADFGDGAVKNAAKIPSLDGYFDVIGHGTPVSMIGASGAEMSAAEVASQVRATPSWGGQSVRLLSCDTGASAGGFAQQLANELGVSVRAPTTWFKPDHLGRIKMPASGQWADFYPQ